MGFEVKKKPPKSLPVGSSFKRVSEIIVFWKKKYIYASIEMREHSFQWIDVYMNKQVNIYF